MSRDLGIGGDDGFSLQDVHYEVDHLDHRLHPQHRGHGRSPAYVMAPQESTIEEEGGEGDEGPRVPGVPPVLSPDDYRAKYQEHVYRLPQNPTWKDYCLFLPRAIYMFVERLCDAFGYKFIGLLACVYGLSQGLGENYMAMSSDYYLKDVLELEPAQAQAFKSLIHLPWNIKPIYGLISDTVPVRGFHRGPYIIIAGALGALAWLLLAFLPPTFNLSALLFLLANYSIASPDVIIDAAVTERSQQAPMYASDLQSLSWGSHALGGILGCSTVGTAQAHLHSRGVFALNSLTAMSILVLAAMRWLPEKQIPPGQARRNACRGAWHKGGQRSLYLLAFFVAICAVVLATTVNHIEDRLIAGYITLTVAACVTIAVYMVLARISPKIARPAIYFFLREAVQPNFSEAMFYWYTSAPGGPMFKPQFLGILDCIASVSMIVGIALYNRYMSGWKYRTIFTASQFLMVGAGMLDFVLVKRLNLKVGISDKAFVLGDEALVPLLRRFAAIPFFVLAAKVCPEKCEATLFALLMALSNFGGDVGSYMGVGLLKAFGVSRKDYSRLPDVVLVKTACRFIPVLLIPLLIPNASPADEILSEKEKHMDLETDAEEEGERDEGGEIEMGAAGGGSAANGTNPSPTRRRHRGSSGGCSSGSGVDLDRLGSPQDLGQSNSSQIK